MEKLDEVGSLCTERGILDTVRVSWKRACLCLPSALKVCKHIIYAIAAAATLYGPIWHLMWLVYSQIIFRITFLFFPVYIIRIVM